MQLHFRMLKDDDDVTNKEVTLTQFLWVPCAQTQNTNPNLIISVSAFIIREAQKLRLILELSWVTGCHGCLRRYTDYAYWVTMR